MCASPGAMYTWPGIAGSPSTGTFTVTLLIAWSRPARWRVNAADMWSDTRIGGQSVGSAGIISRSASAPPVDAPITTTRPVAHAHQALQEREAVHVRHLDVEREHVRIQRADHVARGERIGRGADHDHVGLLVHDRRDDSADKARIVDDQDFDLHLNSSMSPPEGSWLSRVE